MRILLDYRPALRARSGVGEWVHQLARAVLRAPAGPGGDEPHLTLFSSSWKDRPDEAALADLAGAAVIDRRIPVATLNWAWHHLGWPPVEMLTGRAYDVVHAPHPLLVPSRHGLGVVTIHDLDFLDHPERTRGEIRRDYGPLARAHAARAALVVTVSDYTAHQVEHRLGVPRSRLVVCRSGVPDWATAATAGAVPRGPGHVLFVGTIEPRKNIPGLLAAYRLIVARNPDAPRLVLAGRVPPEAVGWKAEIGASPLAGRVDVRGYVTDAERREAYLNARVLVLPSFEEGFGLPALEAMALGVPVVASDRGALPEVVGDAGTLIDPDSPADLARGIERVLTDGRYAAQCVERGRERARTFTWDRSAAVYLDACREAVARAGARGTQA